MMLIKVRLFASLVDRAGVSQLELSLPEGATAAAAADALVNQFPSLAGKIHRVALAVNYFTVPASTVLCDGDELALLPPVSGG
jgi:molybdopterin converting factor subunit 1